MNSEKQTYRILMLEDAPTDAELISNSLKHEHLEFKLFRVEDRNSYMSGLKSFGPDIIISDYGLPNYTGLAAYADMRLKGFDLPFILVTGSLPDEVAVDCLKAGIDDYVLKDRLSRLPEAIQNVMNRRRLEQERRRAMQQLVKSQHNLEVAERLADMGNWEWDTSSGRVIWSKQLYQILGLDPKTTEPSHDMLFERMHPDDREEVREAVDRLVQGGTDTASIKGRIITPEGEVKHVHGIYSSNVDDNTARSIRIFGTLQDVTELHRTEQSLRELTEKLEQRVEERTEELIQANRDLEYRNREMTESLHYAKMIQQALLSDLTSFRQAFPDSFVLWLPKDIVSGDFYWSHHEGDMSYVAAVDCTGHGVPGALMSAIGHQLLARIMNEGKLTEPVDILRQLDNGIVAALRQQDGHRMQDGMDIALCRIDRNTRKVCFAGAFRPLFIWTGDKVDELPCARAAIGSSLISRKQKKFFQTDFTCKEGDILYLTSDGFYSQFGGTQGKKMMKGRFKEMLAEIGAMPLKVQKYHLSDKLWAWQDKEPQVDDILVMGIRL